MMFLIAYKKKFSKLNAPKSTPLGNYQIQWLGPNWFQSFAKTGLQFLHFRYWWGKSFRTKEEAINLFQKPNEFIFQEKYKMFISIERSRIDGNQSLFLRYTKEAPFPWPYFVDEFREQNDGTLLGMSYPKFAPFMALPFLIEKR